MPKQETISPLFHPVVRRAAPWINTKEYFTYSDLARYWSIGIKAARMRVYRLGIAPVHPSGNCAIIEAADLAQAIMDHHFRSTI